jgi:hypothetical protein
MTVTYNPNPNAGDDARQALAKKLSDALKITCEKHGQRGKIQITTCCDELEKQIADFLESK